jgi:hypothetical protein
MKSKNIRWIWVALATMASMFVATLSTSATPPSNDDIPITRWVSPDDSQPITYAEWQAQQPPPAPLYLEQAFSLEAAPQGANGKVVALVNSSIYPDIATSLDQWQTDVEGEGWSVDILPASFPSPASLRSYLTEIPELVGCLLIGDFPVPWYELDVADHEEFPIDLYYMDLNGDWVDNDKDGIYDEHTGYTAPEIWIGRLTASPLTFGGNEATLFNNYFAKNHAYRQGSLALQPRALNYVDDDWYGFADQWGSALTRVCDVTTTISDQEVTRAIDYADRLDDSYTWIQVCAHSWPGGHSFMYNTGQSWDYIYNSDIYDIDPHAFFYNLFACSAARFVESDYIGGWYIFVDTYGVAAVGSTKLGSMLGFEHFYTPLDQGKPLGEAFREWFGNVGIHDPYWHYGMALLGDPTLTSASQCNAPPEITEIGVNETAINEGDTITLTVDFSDLGQNEHQAVIQWGDGVSQSLDVAYGTSQFSVAHLYQDDEPSGTSSDETTILVTILDDDGGSDEASTTINVSNVPPEITEWSVSPSTIDENGLLTLDVQFVDPGTDEHKVTISWGDETSDTFELLIGTRQFSTTHQYLDGDSSGTPGDEVTILVTVLDDDGGSDEASTTVVVSNVAPEITDWSVSPSAIDENDILTLDVHFTDPGADEHEVAVSWGDGTSDTYELLFGSRQFSTTHQYLDDEPSGTSIDETIIQVTVLDDDGGSDDASPTVVVSNVAPVVSIDSITDETGATVGGVAVAGQVGVEMTVVGSFFDVGTLDTHTVLIDWDDGTVEELEEVEGHVSGEHVYETLGLYLITLTVTDDDGGVGVAIAEFEVAEPSDPLEEAVEDLTDILLDPDLHPKAASAIQKALDKVQGEKKGEAENGVSDLMEKESWNAALEKIKQAVEALEAAEVADTGLDLSHVKSLLVVTAKKIVVEQIELAESEATKPKELERIAQANNLVNEGNDLLADHDYISAIERYLAAQRKVQAI